MSKYPGYKCKIAIGQVTVSQMNKWSLPGKVNTIIEKTVFLAEFQEFSYGNAKGGEVSFSGYWDAEDTTGQAVLITAWENKTNIEDLRVYYGTGTAEFFRLTAGATLYIETLDIGEADISGLVPISFTLRVSGGYFEKASACYEDDDVTFSHEVGDNNDTVTKSAGTSFVTLGFVAGQTLFIEGSDLNDGYYTIYNVAANVLTLTSDAIDDEASGDDITLTALPA